MLFWFPILLARAADRPPTPTPDPPPPRIEIGTAAYATAHTACDRPALNRAITFYRQHYRVHREAMWQDGPVPRVWYRDCIALKRRAEQWRDRADVARIELVEWRVYHYRWEDWLPRGWYRVGSCETGYGGPPNWRHRNSSYEGAFGFAVSTWDGYKGEAERRFGDGPYPASAADATPRQQWNVALVVYSHFGLSGWGCRGAYYT